MKWFKHETNSSHNEKLALLQAVCGLEGYGFYWALLEVVVEKAPAPGEASASFPVKAWCGLLCISPQAFKRLLAACSSIGLFSVSYSEVLGKKVVKIASEGICGECDDVPDEVFKGLFGEGETLSLPLALERSVHHG